jgi:curved DNA-binding protein CbpA
MKTFKDYLLETTMTLPLAKEVLGLTGAYTSDDVKKAYQLASNKHHPDKGGDVEVMKKVNVAYQMLKSTSAGSSAIVDWDAIGEKYKKLAEYVDKDLKSKYNPQVFADYFEKIFGQKFNNETRYRDNSESKNPTYAGVTTNFKTEDGKIAFDFDISVYLSNLAKPTKGLSSKETISYPMGITAFGYANMKKQKMTARDYNSKNDHSIFTDPSLVFPTAKLKKMLVVGTNKKMTKADFVLGLDKEVDITNWNKPDNVYLVNLKDGFAMIRRSVIMRMPYWSLMGIGEKKGAYSFDTKIRIYQSYPENKETLDLFKSLNKLTQEQSETLLKKNEE